MILFRMIHKSDDDELLNVRAYIPHIIDKCLDIYERRRDLFFINKYLRRILDEDSYMKLDIIEECLRTIIDKRYFDSHILDAFLCEDFKKLHEEEDV